MNNITNTDSTQNSQFYQNKECEYFPCHETKDIDNFNCLFCFCPLYTYKEHCGGSCRYTKDGIKDCSGCELPHFRNNYWHMIQKIKNLSKM